MILRNITLFLLTVTCVSLQPVSAATTPDSPSETEVDMKKACTAWYKRLLKRQAQTAKHLKQVKNDSSAKKAVVAITKVYRDKTGAEKDPCPDDELMRELYPIHKDKKITKSAIDIGRQLNRISMLVEEEELSQSAAAPLFDLVGNVAIVSEPDEE